MNLEQSQQRERELERERQRDLERQKAKERERLQKERYVLAQASRELASIDAEPIDSDSSDGGNFSSPAHHITAIGAGVQDRISQHNSDSHDSNINSLQHDEDSRTSIHSITPSSPLGGIGANMNHTNNNSSNNNSNNNSISDRPPGTPPMYGTGPPSTNAPIISLNLGAANAKKKKLEMKDVFNMDDDNEELSGPKKRKLVPLGNSNLII